MDAATKKQLEIAATRIRMAVIEGTYHAKSGHPGGSLSIADTLSYLYFAEMRIRPEQPDWEDRDRFVLSKGHAAPALYGALAARGYFSEELIPTLRHIGSILQGHPDMKHIPGVDMSTGSLGQGVSAAAGMALGAKLSGKDFRVYTILGDGEIEEGQVWEVKGRPTAIIQKSIKGKGVDFMENQVGWHGKAPNAEEYEKAMTALRAALAAVSEGEV